MNVNMVWDMYVGRKGVVFAGKMKLLDAVS